MLVRCMAILPLIRRLLRRSIRMDWPDQAKSTKVSQQGAFSQFLDPRPAVPVIIIIKCPCGRQQFGHTSSNEGRNFKLATCSVAAVARLVRVRQVLALAKHLLTL